MTDQNILNVTTKENTKLSSNKKKDPIDELLNKLTSNEKSNPKHNHNVTVSLDDTPITDKMTTVTKSNEQLLSIPLEQDKQYSITAIADNNKKSN